MKSLNIFKNALFALALIGFSAPQAEAIEIFGGANPAAHMNDDMITQVRGGARHGGGHRGGGHRGGGHRGGMHHGGGHRGGGHRGGMHGRPGGVHGRPGGVHRPATRPGNVNRGNVHRNVNRNVNRNINRNVNVNRAGYRGGAVWVGRPSWYRWNPGGAIAAGAAIGFVSAAAAASWAGAAPSSGLCWYYTDPSRRQGFWDVCP